MYHGHGGIRKLASGIRKLEVVFGNWTVVFGNSKVVFGNSKVVFRNWYSEIRNPLFGNWELSCIPKLENDRKWYLETGGCIRKLFFGNWNPGIGKFSRHNHRRLMWICHHPLSSTMVIPHEDKLKLRSCSIYWPEGVAILLSLRSYSMYWPERVAVLIPPGQKLKLRSYSMYGPEGVAVLIHHEDKFKVRSTSSFWIPRIVSEYHEIVSEADENSFWIPRVVSESDEIVSEYHE